MDAYKENDRRYRTLADPLAIEMLGVEGSMAKTRLPLIPPPQHSQTMTWKTSPLLPLPLLAPITAILMIRAIPVVQGRKYTPFKLHKIDRYPVNAFRVISWEVLHVERGRHA